MNPLLILPILLPLLTAILSVLTARWRVVQRTLGVLGTAGLLLCGLLLVRSVWLEGIQTAQMGNWPAPFGITLAADLFGAIMVALAGLMGFSVSVYSLASIDAPRERFGYYTFMHVMLMGICGAFLTGDIFNMYVWFEVLLIASFILMALGGERAQMEGAIKYVVLNLISSALFLAALGIIYGKAGTLNMADLAAKLASTKDLDLISISAMLLFVAFGIKAAVFPLFFWLPASYHTPPVAVTAIFAGLLTKVGVYSLIRLFTLLFVHDVEFTHRLILIISGFTMVTGVLGAVAQTEFRRLLSFHIVSQIGYLIMGLGLYSRLALAGSIFFIFHVAIAKAALFLVSGVVYRLGGTYELKKLGGFYRSHGYLAVLFLVPALSLAGMPPLSGFFAKLCLVKAGLEQGEFTIVAVALVVSLLTLLSMTKIWAYVFWSPKPETSIYPYLQRGSRASRVSAALVGPILVFVALNVVQGLAVEPFMAFAYKAADQLLDPSQYIQAVLGAQL